MRDTLSGIFDVADPTGAVTLTSPVWVPGWHAPLLKLTKATITPNRDDTHDLHRLVDDLFSQLQERMTAGSSGPDAFRALLADFANYFNRAPRGATLATLQNFGVRIGTPFASYLRALRVVEASTVEKGGPLAPSAAVAMELVRTRTAQQYPMLMTTLFPGDLATREKLYVTLRFGLRAAGLELTRFSGCSRFGCLSCRIVAPQQSPHAIFAYCIKCLTCSLPQGPL